jgi:hypothetical protein
MENPAAVERRARALVMFGVASYASAVENRRRSRRKLLMVGAIVAKLARRRRFGRQDSAISSALLRYNFVTKSHPEGLTPL